MHQPNDSIQRHTRLHTQDLLAEDSLSMARTHRQAWVNCEACVIPVALDSGNLYLVSSDWWLGSPV